MMCKPTFVIIISGFAKTINMDDLPFIVNWCGPEIKPMAVDDEICLVTLVKIIDAIDDIKPEMEGKFQKSDFDLKLLR